MRLILTLAALAALSACSTTWSLSQPTEEQRAIARYLCLDDPAPVGELVAERGVAPTASAVRAYVEARFGTVMPHVSAAVLDLGPERELYCVIRGLRVAGE